MGASNRRDFLKAAAAGVAAAGAISPVVFGQDQPTGERVVVGVMGLGRGSAIASGLASLPNVVVKYVCDVDEKVANSAVKTVGAKAAANKNSPAPTPIGDFRRILEDKDVHALAIAAPDHW